MGLATLKSVPCPKCGLLVENVKVDEDSILNATRVPVLVSAKCSNGHSCILFVDRNLTIRDIESASDVVQEEELSSVDKAQRWMSDF